MGGFRDILELCGVWLPKAGSAPIAPTMFAALRGMEGQQAALLGTENMSHHLRGTEGQYAELRGT